MNIPTKAILPMALALALAAPWSAASARNSPAQQDQDWRFLRGPASGLVQAVRDAASKYQDVNQAIADGYGPAFGCVSSPDDGAMGVHYFNFNYLGDGAIELAHPEVLVYEPTKFGQLRLVAVEYLEDATTWDENPSNGDSPPILMGQLFDYVGFPNRFRAGAFYNLHVWAWKYNPNGEFSMWNPRVSCADYTPS